MVIPKKKKHESEKNAVWQLSGDQNFWKAHHAIFGSTIDEISRKCPVLQHHRMRKSNFGNETITSVYTEKIEISVACGLCVEFSMSLKHWNTLGHEMPILPTILLDGIDPLIAIS